MPASSGRLLLTCEHAGNRVPSGYQRLFAGREPVLRSHRGWDPGALLVARGLARALRAPLLFTETTRLLVDPNRSAHNPAVFSEITRRLSRDERERLLARHHRPHRDRVRASIRAFPGATLHVAVHSFTPRWQGTLRRFTVGLLYDPGRPRERSLAMQWQRELRQHLGRHEVRRNAPYRGDADGLTTALRREFGGGRYLGLELELNQRAVSTPRSRRALVAVLARTLRAAGGATDPGLRRQHRSRDS